MKIVFRLGVTKARYAELGTKSPDVEVIVAKSWEEFKPSLSTARIVYLPHYILRTLPGGGKAAIGELFQLDAKTPFGYNLPEYVVSGNVHENAPRNPKEAALRLANDIMSNIKLTGLQGGDQHIVAIWSGFFTEDMSLADFAQTLVSPRSKRKSDPSLRDVLAKIKKLQAEADALRRKEANHVIESIREAIETYGLTAADFGLAPQQHKRLSGKKRELPVTSGDKQSSIWSGRGKKPVWLTEALAHGQPLAEFAAGLAAPQAAESTPGTRKSRIRGPSGKSVK